jgi:hypothetical protein
MRVEAYWNLHKGCISYRATGKGSTVRHADSLRLEDVTFTVQPAGRARVLREGVKNVHAYVRGQIVAIDASQPDGDGWLEVTYNPYRYDSFITTLDGLPIYAARDVIIQDKRVYARRLP